MLIFLSFQIDRDRISVLLFLKKNTNVAKMTCFTRNNSEIRTFNLAELSRLQISPSSDPLIKSSTETAASALL